MGRKTYGYPLPREEIKEEKKQVSVKTRSMKSVIQGNEQPQLGTG